MVVRRRLVEMLDCGVRRAVTLVCAGPGWGKSTLVASWAEARAASGPVAWLTLSAQHNESPAFWSDVMMALRMAGVDEAGFDAAHLRSGLAGLPAPVVLVLDDFHELTDPRVVGELSVLLHDPPPALRVVVISRGEPSLPLHRFRAAGDLTEIRARHLAFRATEAAELPVVHRQRLPVLDLAELLDRSEGWVVGLQLLAGVLAEDGGPVNGEIRAITDYLLREVVAMLPVKTRMFLLRTSVPESVCGPLADALTGDLSGRTLLERLERADAFVTRDPARPGWFRYHPLLRDALRHQLDLDGPGTEPALHLLAAQWYARERLILDALRHAAAAGDWPLFGRICVEHAMIGILSGERGPLVEVLRQVPAERHADTPELALCAAAVRYDSGDRGGAAVMMALVRSPSGLSPSTGMTLRLMEAGLRLWRPGDMPGLVDAATDTLRRLAGFRLDELPSLLQFRAVALDEKGSGLLWMDQPDHADRYLWAAATAARSVGVTLIEISALSHLALLVYLQGSLREATEFVNSALDLARRTGFETSAQAGLGYLTLALIELEYARVAEAQEALRNGLHAGGEEPSATLSVVSAVVRAGLLIMSGEPAAARALLGRARAEAPPTLNAPLLERWVALTESEADLALGSPREVIARYRPAPARGTLTPAEQVCLARAHLAVSDHQEAEGLLARVRQGTNHVAVATAWIATAFSADAEGHGNRSIDALSHAVLAAEREGIRRPFRRFDERRMAALLDRRRWLDEHELPGEGVLGPDGSAQPPADVLSERERDVLRYLPTVLTAGEIAGNLNISINTVKAHMRAIYRKLGAARRREAVVRARQIGLI
ncbi:transcriptional regulator [Paractinoplanes tereljensis]|uniref:Transcriptional regulator n=2 Tax=Paractinoplanes tereljensis TaxID=571912 RepID=A0A919TU34_9ACTN|nr:transcriptional regulator [Actinoplanes tereljensis]